MIEWAPDETVWEQMCDVLRKRIQTGVYKPRMPLPSITHLEQEFGVARGTVKKVLNKLKEDGYIRAIPGKGTFVVPRPERGASD
ncbi:GntR family transcriptional regulator [Nonomuraea sp. NPDC001023]|uniref:GntR family transcriptional regulator n=1 Tax=unclassified Nonomuraea TaxID=2593643 RepID=UPI003333C0E0